VGAVEVGGGELEVGGDEVWYSRVVQSCMRVVCRLSDNFK
jgi:hypothetical protein